MPLTAVRVLAFHPASMGLRKAGGRAKSDVGPASGNANATHHVVFFQHPDEWIDRRVVAKLQRKLDDAVTSPRSQTMIDVWIDSGGGDPMDL